MKREGRSTAGLIRLHKYPPSLVLPEFATSQDLPVCDPDECVCPASSANRAACVDPVAKRRCGIAANRI